MGVGISADLIYAYYCGQALTMATVFASALASSFYAVPAIFIAKPIFNKLYNELTISKGETDKPLNKKFLYIAENILTPIATFFFLGYNKLLFNQAIKTTAVKYLGLEQGKVFFKGFIANSLRQPLVHLGLNCFYSDQQHHQAKQEK
jgi:hypothetical protein